MMICRRQKKKVKNVSKIDNANNWDISLKLYWVPAIFLTEKEKSLERFFLSISSLMVSSEISRDFSYLNSMNWNGRINLLYFSEFLIPSYGDLIQNMSTHKLKVKWGVLEVLKLAEWNLRFHFNPQQFLKLANKFDAKMSVITHVLTRVLFTWRNA